MTALAIIPARGGSKRLPRKNLKPFVGIPIIGYSILAAIESKCFDEVVVSTDDPEIADIARRFGATVPFLRSEKNADDFATLSDVMAEVLAEFAGRARTFDEFCCILPTAPLLRVDDLVASRKLLGTAPAVFSGVRFGYPIWRALQVSDGKASMIWPEHVRTRSQDLPAAFHDAGMFYWANCQTFLEERSFFLEGARLWELPESRVQDIDSQEDWDIAELKFNLLGATSKQEQAPC